MPPPLGSGRMFSGGAPLTTVFKADFTTPSVGDMSAAAFASLYGLTFTRASDGYSVQTSASTLTTGLTGNDRPRIGQFLSTDTSRGLVLEPARTNSVVDSTSMEVSPGKVTVGGAAVPTVTPNFVVGPDGVTMADRQVVLSGNYGNYFDGASVLASAQGNPSHWVRATSGTSLIQGTDTTAFGTDFGLNSPTTTPIDTTWRRIEMVRSRGNAGVSYAPEDGRNFAGTPPGIAAHASDLCIVHTQFEATVTGSGEYNTELITTSGARLTRAVERLSHASASSLCAANGQLRLEVEFIPKASQLLNGRNINLIEVPGGASNYIYVDFTTGTVQVAVNNVGRAFAAFGGALWAKKDNVRFFVCIGASLSTTCSYSINGAASVTIAPQAALAGTMPASTAYFMSDNALNYACCWLRKLATYKTGLSPSWV